MKNEAEFKSFIKKSVTFHKGYSMSLAAPMLVGIPDLFVVMPKYIPILLEAKWLGELTRDKFSRKMQFTEMQIHFISQCHEVTPYSAMGVVGFYYRKELHIALLKFGTPLFYNFDSTFLTDCAYVKYDMRTKRFDMQSLFEKVPIPRIQQLNKRGVELVIYGTRDKMAV